MHDGMQAEANKPNVYGRAKIRIKGPRRMMGAVWVETHQRFLIASTGEHFADPICADYDFTADQINLVAAIVLCPLRDRIQFGR